MPTLSCDAVVIGAGPNGLAAAYGLSRQGRSVVVVEASDRAGGGAVARPNGAGALAHLSYNLDGRVVRAMNLSAHGLSWVAPQVATTSLSSDGAHLRLVGAVGDVIEGNLSARDRSNWSALRARLLRYAGVLSPLNEMAPPRLARNAGNPLGRLAKMALRARLMGAADVRELGRILLTNAYDLLDDELDAPLLTGALALDATLGSWLGPRSPNSVLPWLVRLSGRTEGVQGAIGIPRGGMGAVAMAMENAVKAAGVQAHYGARVATIRIENGTAKGVVLSDGTEIAAPLVVSSAAPSATLLSLVGPRHLDAGLTTRLRQIKARGGAAKLHLTLRSEPDFKGANLKDRLVIAPSLNHVERAFNPVKYGRVPDAPVMEIVVQTAHEPAPDGKCRISAVVQYAPHNPADRDAARAEMLRACLAQLDTFAPGLSGLVEAADMLMPYDIEAAWGLPGGSWHAEELSVEQMYFLRPLPGIAQYRSPIAGLWFASAGCHPGGGVSGTAGWNAAQAIGEVGR